jgi:hypothetical protein
LQRNEISLQKAKAFWRSKTPRLDDDTARVDTEIYLRRPTSYEIGYTVGRSSMHKGLANRNPQLRDDFILGAFLALFLAKVVTSRVTETVILIENEAKASPRP